MNQDEKDTAMHKQIRLAHGDFFMRAELADQERHKNVFIRGAVKEYLRWVNNSGDGNALIKECMDRGVLTIQDVEGIGAVLDSTDVAHNLSALQKKRNAETDPEVELPPPPAVDPDEPWDCRNCTFRNPPLFLACKLCFMTVEESERL